MRPRCCRLPGLLLGILLPLAGCRGEPARSLAPSPASSAAAPAAMSAPAAPAPVAGSAQPSATAPSPGAPSAAASAAAAPDVAAEPSLVGVDGAPLPQTEERPSVESERFKRRMRRLADAILRGDAESARDTFFPLVAYAQVKDVQKPERDYRYRLMANFTRDVRDYHRSLGKGASGAEFLGASVPEERAQWMKPGKEGNRLGYFRVLRSKLRFRLPTGVEKTLELTSMISWRGEWYVVHLHGFE